MHSKQHYVEFIFAKCLIAVLKRTPLAFNSGLGFVLGKLAVALPTGMRKKSVKQIRYAMPELSYEQALDIAKESAVHMLQTFFEMPRIYNACSKCLTKMLSVEGWEHIQNAEGAIILTAHYGNWEAILRQMAISGIDSTVVYRPANNKLVDALITELRLKTGVKVSPKGRAGARILLKAAKAGGYLGILNDQRMSDGKTLSLFGKEAKTSTGFADLALKYNLSAFPVFCERIGFGRYKIEVMPPLSVDKTLSHDEQVLALTQAYNDVLEQRIRKNPSQWMWQHKRFTDA